MSEAGKGMSIFWTQNRSPQNAPSLARVLIRLVWWDPVGPRSWATVGPKLGSVGPGGSQLFSTWDFQIRVRWDAVGPGGSQPFSTWDPSTPFARFYNANYGPSCEAPVMEPFSLPFTL